VFGTSKDKYVTSPNKSKIMQTTENNIKHNFFVDLFITTFVYLFINRTTGGLSDPSTLNINNNKKKKAKV